MNDEQEPMLSSNSSSEELPPIGNEGRKNTISNLSAVGENEHNLSSSDSVSFRNVNEIIQNSKNKDFSLTYLESSFSSHSSREVGNRNFFEENEIKRKAKLRFMIGWMMVYLFIFAALVAYLTFVAFTTKIGFIAEGQSAHTAPK